METAYREFKDNEKECLRGYLSWQATSCRVFFFVIVALVLLKAFYAIYMYIGGHIPSLAQYHWWLGPAILCVCFIYWFFGKFINRPAFLKQVRKDLRCGKAAVHTINVDEVIEVSEMEDEGPAYIVRSDENETIIFSGQYLLKYKEKGFPWTTLEVAEAPTSKVFLGLRQVGAHLEPSLVRQQFSYADFKKFSCNKEYYKVLDVNYEEMKGGSVEVKAKVGVVLGCHDLEKLYYHGTDVEIKLGDNIIYKTILGIKLKGTVWYLPGESPKHSEMEHDNVKYWAVMLTNGTMISLIYLPQEIKATKRVAFISKAESNVQGLQTTDEAD